MTRQLARARAEANMYPKERVRAAHRLTSMEVRAGKEAKARVKAMEKVRSQTLMVLRASCVNV